MSTKKELIEKYGIEWYNAYKERSLKNRNSEKSRVTNNAWRIKNRNNGKTQFCTNDYEQIENYELALADNFDRTKWVLHHRDEQFWKHSTLKERGEYYNLTPDKLIWLPASEHKSDSGLSYYYPERSIWHQRIYDR